MKALNRPSVNASDNAILLEMKTVKYSQMYYNTCWQFFSSLEQYLFLIECIDIYQFNPLPIRRAFCHSRGRGYSRHNKGTIGTPSPEIFIFFACFSPFLQVFDRYK